MHISCLGAAILILLGTSVWRPAARAEDQASGFGDGQVKIFDAQSLVGLPLKRQVALHHPLELPLLDTPEAKAIAEKGFEIRLFPIDDLDAMPREWTTVGPCLVYLSWTLGRFQTSLDTINTGAIDNIAYLSPKRDLLRSGYYLAVFQTWTDESDQWFRLQKSEVPAFFSKGLRIQIDPDKAYDAGVAYALGDKIAAAQKTFLQQAETVKSTLICYSTKPVPGKPSLTMLVADAGHCDTTN